MRPARLGPGRKGLAASLTAALFVGLAPWSAPAQDRGDREAPAGERGGRAAFDLSFVPADAVAVVAGRPSALLAREEVRSLVEQLPGFGEVQQRLGLRPEGIEQAVVVVYRRGPALDGPGRPAAATEYLGLILRSSEPQDWKAMAGRLGPEVQAVETRSAGVTYFKLAGRHGPRSDGPAPCFYVADDRTVVLAAEPNLIRSIRRGDAEAGGFAWSDAWSEVAGSDMAAAVDMTWVREQVEAMRRGGPGRLGPVELAFSPLWEETTAAAAGLDVSGGLGARLVATCGDEAGAGRVADTLRAVLTLGRNVATGLDELITQAPPQEAERVRTLFDRGRKALESAEVEREGPFVRFSASSDVPLGELIGLLSGVGESRPIGGPARLVAPTPPAAEAPKAEVREFRQR